MFDLTPGQQWTLPALEKIADFVTRSGRDAAQSDPLRRVLLAWTTAGFPSSTAADLAQLFTIRAGQAEALLTALPVDPDAFTALDRLADGVRLTERSGLDPTSLRQLTATSYAGLAAARDLVLGAMRTKYPSEAAWQAVEEPFKEKVEGLKRDALVDRILSRPN